MRTNRTQAHMSTPALTLALNPTLALPLVLALALALTLALTLAPTPALALIPPFLQLAHKLTSTLTQQLPHTTQYD